MSEVSFAAAMALLAKRDPSAPALTVGSRTLTREELDRRSNRRAQHLKNLAVRGGDLVVLAVPNGHRLLENALALWKLGATPVPVSPQLPEMELAAIVELGAARVVVGGSSAPGRLPADWEPPSTTSDDDLPDVVPAAWKALCSGGSTGRPKLILEGTPGLIDPQSSQGFGLEPEGIQLVTAPLYHNAPFGYATRGLLTGQHVVVMPRFDPVEMLTLVEKHRVQWTMVVPTMMSRVSRLAPEERARFDVSSLQRVWHMAAPCPPDVKRDWIGWLGPDVVWELYGSTEQIAATVISGSDWLTHPGSIGRPVFGEIRVLDAAGQAVPDGEVGELFLRSPDRSRTFRYLGAEVQELPGGWTSVGDLGSRDADGYFYVADRRLDLIVSGGANVYPAEVEAAIASHPSVVEAVVVGLADDDLGQRVHAIVRVDGDVDEDRLLAHLRDRIVRYKVPRSVEFTQLPLRDEAGKVRRSALRADRERG